MAMEKAQKSSKEMHEKNVFGATDIRRKTYIELQISSVKKVGESLKDDGSTEVSSENEQRDLNNPLQIVSSAGRMSSAMKSISENSQSSSSSSTGQEYGNDSERSGRRGTNPMELMGPKGRKISTSSSRQLSLDVLAQVASATLATDHTLSVRNAQSMDSLDLKQIQRLTDKSLVNLFASTSYDEIKRNYSLTCQIVPDSCSETFTSFGNETRAKSMVCQHLRRHLRELEELEKLDDPDIPPFSAIPVPTITKMKRAFEKSDRLKKRRSKQLHNTALLQKYASKQRLTSPRNSPTSYSGASATSSKSDRPRILGKPKDVLVVDKTNTVDVSTLLERKSDSLRDGQNDESIEDVALESSRVESTSSDHFDHNDHNYTTIYGKRYTEGGDESDVDMDDDDDEGRGTKAASTTTCLMRPYPPMPKYDAAATRVVMEDEVLSSDDDKSSLKNDSAAENKDSKNTEVKERNEWERKTALRCIRELRQRKKDEFVPLVCKICQDRAFTAAATLTYHYRSHAGIKPYICLICNTTFTRQHSLNYHMLIHNNQSRFSCPDCGRKFRHPSHFKEHMRRHTGETPFTCTDCPVRFKTRNTYKRHLKTRHGKLLTATGIHRLSSEEFKRVQTTKQYKLRQQVQTSVQNNADNLTVVEIEGEESSSSVKKPKGRKLARKIKYELVSDTQIEELRQRQQVKEASTAAPTKQVLGVSASQTPVAQQTATATISAEASKFILLSGLNGQSILLPASSIISSIQPQPIVQNATTVVQNVGQQQQVMHQQSKKPSSGDSSTLRSVPARGQKTNPSRTTLSAATTSPGVVTTATSPAMTYTSLRNADGATLVQSGILPTLQVLQQSPSFATSTSDITSVTSYPTNNVVQASQPQQVTSLLPPNVIQTESPNTWTLVLGGAMQNQKIPLHIQSPGALNAFPVSVTLVPVSAANVTNITHNNNNNYNNGNNNNSVNINDNSSNISMANSNVSLVQNASARATADTQQLTSLLATLQNIVPLNKGQPPATTAAQ